ncbi:MAG: BNR repeat-containing protein [Bacteroidales bacterium]|nr:BNR repeat-containing protein [Bacteroidales bacterium]
MIINTLKLIAFLLVLLCFTATAQTESEIGPGWSRTSVNAVIFRKNSVVTFRNHQFVAYYDSLGYMTLARRKHGSEKWTVKQTRYKGNVKDAHNSISIMVDGKGYLHFSWDHHNNPLNYARSLKPLSLELSEKMPMTGKNEEVVSYPEFYRLPDGDLLFFYRLGGSGNGNMVINRYYHKTSEWKRVHDVLIDGENKRNAYWQATVDGLGTIHVSWVWRETPDVASNHDLCYAKSDDGGVTWKKSDGTVYNLPITAATAEYACKIPPKSELINQTSMAADSKGRPYIVSYWREQGNQVPQYFMVYRNGDKWNVSQVSQRKEPFSLSGMGTKKIPISRPQVVVDERNGIQPVVLFRDLERGSHVTIAVCENPGENDWRYTDLTAYSVGDWEPTYDTELWRNRKELHIFVQNVGQGDAETQVSIEAQPVRILEWER